MGINRRFGSLAMFIGVFGLLVFSSPIAAQVRLGAALPLSGALGASWGNPEERGIRLAVEETNLQGGIRGTPVQLFIEDTKGDNLGTVNAVKKLVSVNKVDALVGPTWLDSFQGAIPIIEQAEVPTITPSAGPLTLTRGRSLRWIFTMYPSEERQFSALIALAKALEYKRIALVYDEDPYWATFARMARDQLGELAVAEERFNIGITDLRSWLARLRPLRPDAFLGGFVNQESFLALLRQTRDAGMTIPLITTDTGCEFRSDPSFHAPLEGSRCIYIRDTFHGDFVERYKKHYGELPTQFSSRAYDAATILLRSLAQSHGSDQARKYIEGNEHSTMSYGPVRFNPQHGTSGGEFVGVEVKNGVLVPLNVTIAETPRG